MSFTLSMIGVTGISYLCWCEYHTFVFVVCEDVSSPVFCQWNCWAPSPLFAWACQGLQWGRLVLLLSRTWGTNTDTCRYYTVLAYYPYINAVSIAFSVFIVYYNCSVTTVLNHKCCLCLCMRDWHDILAIFTHPHTLPYSFGQTWMVVSIFCQNYKLKPHMH